MVFPTGSYYIVFELGDCWYRSEYVPYEPEDIIPRMRDLNAQGATSIYLVHDDRYHEDVGTIYSPYTGTSGAPYLRSEHNVELFTIGDLERKVTV